MGDLPLLLTLMLAGLFLVQPESLQPLRRSKRRWVLTTIVLEEEDPGPFPKLAGELFNDRAANMSIKYLISGPGVDEFPELGLFSIDDASGEVYVHRTIDREKTPLFVVRFDVADRASGRIVDKSLIFNVEVKDKNDNAPKFMQNEYTLVLNETDNLESPLLQTKAIDNDKEDTENSEVVYSLVSQTPPLSDITFSIDPKNGLIRGKGCLHYETSDKIQLLVRARDSGAVPMSSTATVNIIIEDGNNHMPVIIEQKYEGNIREGEMGTNISRICVEDKDTPKTPAWRAKYKILSGNEKGNYKMSTDPESNDGILSVIKPIDFEGTADRKLIIAVENEIPLFSCEKGKMRSVDSNSLSSVSLRVNVVDVNDAPRFIPNKQIIREKEGLKPGTVLGRCNATDPDLISNKIRYKVAYDPEGWVTVDENTGVITSVKELDRESPFVNHSIYPITVHAVDDGVPPQTGTGTVLLYVSDINDNTPHLLAPYMEVCEQVKSPSLTVQAADKDLDPYSGPFLFELMDETKTAKETWKLGETDGESVQLVLLKSLPKGNHSVTLNMYDRQGVSRMEDLTVRICSCPDGRTCERMAPAAHFLGGSSIAVMITPLLLFLLALLLLTCLVCGSKHKHSGLPAFDDGNQTLIKYNEEGGSALSQASSSVLHSTGQTATPKYHINQDAVGTSPISGTPRQVKYEDWTTWNSGLLSPRQSQKEKTSENGIYAKSSLKQNPPKDMFTERVGEMVTNRLRGFSDLEASFITYKPRIYAYEGELERIESVGSFSFPDEVDRDFLDHLGPKFAALGEICRK